MTDALPSSLASWKDALVRWQVADFATLDVPPLKERYEILKVWSYNYPFQLMRAALDGVDVHGPARDISRTALDEVHASAQTALVRLAQEVPENELKPIAERAAGFWIKARTVVHDTLIAPRMSPSAPEGPSFPFPLPNFDAAWPSEMPHPIRKVLTETSLGARLSARRQETVDATPPMPAPARSGLRA